MEKQLEHKIKEGYQKRDENSSFDGKDKLWGQISSTLGHSKGVAAIWRVAAVVLALLSFGGVFGALSYIQNLKQNQNNTELRLITLEQEFNSLANLKPEKVVDTIIVEKEKIVYREIRSEISDVEKTEIVVENLETVVRELTNSLETAKIQLKETKANLEIALAENESLASIETVIEDRGSTNFKLKTERSKDKIQQDRKNLNPTLKLQLLKIHDDIRYDSNATLFKK